MFRLMFALMDADSDADVWWPARRIEQMLATLFLRAE